jgi:hypothetical protein
MPGTWQPLAHPPTFNASTMLLLTDGAVMCQESGGNRWWRLSPDQTGGYINGTWTSLAPMHQTRLYYASAVLADGRVFVAGGEYSDAGSETNTAEIYDPTLDTWTVIAAPAGWSHIGDGICCVLPDGRVLMGNLSDSRTAIYDPVAGTWAAGPQKDDTSSEETWTLLPDQTVLTVECAKHPKAEKYVAAANAWVSAGTLPVDLVEASSIEIGPALLLPDGRVFAVGATPHTALYTPPPIASQPGSWAAGPDFPTIGGKTLGAKDAPGCLLPNGTVLCVAGPVDGVSGHYLSPTYFFEFDGASLNRVTDPPNAGSVPFTGRMMLLPTGQVLFAAGSPDLQVYTPTNRIPDPAWRPHITASPFLIRPLHTYTLHGRQLNGVSQAVSYGDDATMATNYPIVRIRHVSSGHVTYCRTADHSSMAVATGTAVHSTQFSVPHGIRHGWSELTVIANGISSEPVFANVFQFHFPLPWLEKEMVNILLGSLADGPLWVLGPHGPIPVDPLGPHVKEAQRARQLVLDGIHALQRLGAEAQKTRLAAAAAIAPAVDPELEQAAT